MPAGLDAGLERPRDRKRSAAQAPAFGVHAGFESHAQHKNSIKADVSDAAARAPVDIQPAPRHAFAVAFQS